MEANVVLQQVLDLLANRNQPEVITQIHQLIKGPARDAIQKLLPVDAIIKTGTGKGNMADVPWIAVFPQAVEPSPQTGIYLVYLFAADGSYVYLSLNQGTEKAKTNTIKTRSEAMRTILGPQPGLIQDIELASTSGRPRKYTYGNAYAVAYRFGEFPSDDYMAGDLKLMMGLLERLPRTVHDLDMIIKPSIEELGKTVSWIFQGNPDRYDVMGAVTNLKECTWTVHQYANKVRPGDKVYIWESGRNAGVIAIGQVLTKPELMTRLAEEEPYFRDASLVGSEPASRVRVGIQQVLSAKITRDQFIDHPILSQASILEQPQGTVFPLSSEQAAALDELISGNQRTGRTVRISVNLSLWDDCLGQGYISVGWRDVGDLQQYASLDEVIVAVNQHMVQQYPTARQRELVAHQLWLFRSAQPGDEVVATHGTSTILGIGRVREPGYAWNQERGHNIPIDWDESVAKRIAKRPYWRMAQVEKADLELTELARQLGPGLPKPNTDLSVICDQFTSALLGSNIRFGARHDEIVRSFVVSLATKRFVILTGLSGSGKTQLAVRFGEWLGEGHSCVVAARPDWTGSEALFGYEDALQEPDENGRRPWHVPEALAFMLQAVRDPENPYLLVLDEMNLAHVERYFADVLSGMESEQPVLPNLRAEDDGRWRVAPDAQERIAIPENLFVVGTVNVDETTYMFSPKVLDRANTIEFRVNSDDLTEVARRPIPIEPGAPELVRGFLVIATDDDWHLTQTAVDLAQFTGYLRKLHRVLADSHVQFGHRVVYEANRFAALLAAAGVSDIAAALDLQVLQKVLPRVHGSKRRLGPVLSALGRFCFNPDTLGEVGEEDASSFDPLNPPDGEPKLPLSFRKLGRMVRNLNADQFTSFAE